MSKTAPIKKVLIVDDEKLFLASLQEGMMEFSEEFEVITALNGEKALEELGRQNIDLVVTDLKMPVMDGFQLLTQMISKYPAIPTIVITAFGTPDIENRLQELETFDYLEKPIDFSILAEKIRKGIKNNSDGHLRGIMLFSFLQLIQIEQKSCVLKISSHEKNGTLYFYKGELIDAVYLRLNGEEAAHKIVCWEDSEIEIINTNKQVKRRIDKPLQNLLMDAAKERDEAIFQGEMEDKSSFSETQQNLENSVTNLSLEKKQIEAQTSENSLNQTKKEKTFTMANNIEQSLNELMEIDGAMAVALVDTESGMALGTAGGGVNLDVAAAGNTEVVKSKQKVMANLGLKDKIEDILISLGSQYHLIRPLKTHTNLFIYLVLGREKSNLAMARFKLSDVENWVQV
ncbi:MAG: response regulator [Pyrinomonadaceae bacterium]|nr:response regulator [Pyrinomonadaceae bacterium]